MIKNLSMQDLRDRGLALLDERVRIITAGLGLKELRAVLRGDPATEKPNPRYRVHTTSFVFHIRPRYYQKASTWFTLADGGLPVHPGIAERNPVWVIAARFAPLRGRSHGCLRGSAHAAYLPHRLV